MLQGGQSGGGGEDRGGGGDDYRKPRDKPTASSVPGPLDEIIALLLEAANLGNPPSMLNSRKTDVADEATAMHRTRGWLMGLANCPRTVREQKYSHLAEAVHHVLLAAREAGTFERMVETVMRILLANAEAALDQGDDDE